MIPAVQNDKWPWFLLLSVSIHAAAIAGWFLYSPTETNLARKSDSMVISVGLQTAIAGSKSSTQQNEVSPQPEKKTELPAKEEKNIEQKQPKKEVIKEQVTPKKTVPKQAPAPEKKQEKKPVKQKETKQPRKEQPETKPVTKEAEKPLQTSVPLPKVVASTASKEGAKGVDGSADNKVQSLESGTETQSGASIEEQFDRYIRQHLLKNKKTPKMLKKKRRKGEVIVQFMLDQNGNLLNYKIAQPSRIREFDRAAIKLVKRAAPYPEAPAEVEWQTRQFKIAIRYEIK